MPIGYQDVVAAFPEAQAFTAEQAENFIVAANLGFPDSRFKDARLADRGRINYVMHMMTKPALDLKAPYILARMGSPNPGMEGKAPHPWDGTTYGAALKKAVVA